MTSVRERLSEAARRLRLWPDGLRLRLLLLTVGVIVIVELLIFIPSIASFRTDWLKERVERAQTASIALEASPAFEVTETLARELFANSEAYAVAVRRDGQRELIWSGPPIIEPPVLVDLRSSTMVQRLVETCVTFTIPRGRYLRVVDHAHVSGGEFIEVTVLEAPLKDALWAYSRRMLVASVLIAAAAGVLVYVALAILFVTPMRQLAQAMVWFRQDPNDAARIINPSGRRDEIGAAETDLAALQAEVRAALRQREHLAALGEAVAKINHDLRNILTTAQLVSDRLAANPDPKVRQQAERLVRATDRGVTLAEEVLAYGRAEERPPDLQAVPLRAALHEAFDDASAVSARTAQLELQVEDALQVRADPEHVHRIFVNLIRNAVQALGAHRTSGEELGVITLTATPNGRWIAADVADNGPGVPQEAREDLFTPFSSARRRGGTGLGLSIARELARANGGDVELADTGAWGARFRVRLPIA